MPDEEGQGSEVIETPEYSSPETTEEVTAPPAEQGNPFWKDVEDRVGPNVFTTIKPFLDKADAEAQKGIANANERLNAYKPYQSFIDQGTSPEMLTQAMQLAQQIQSDPGYVYEQLGNFLKENGRLPSPTELKKEVEDGQDPAEEEDPRDAQMRQLQEQSQQMQQYLAYQAQQQQQQELAREADAWADQQIRDITSKHPEFSKEDLGEILRMASYQSQQSGGEIDLNKAVEAYTALQTRIRTAPRPGATAPRVPGGAGGGTPAEGQKRLGDMTPAERQALVAARLGSNQ